MCISFEFLNPLISSEWFFFQHHFYKPAFAILYTSLVFYPLFLYSHMCWINQKQLNQKHVKKLMINIWSIIEDWITFLFEGKALKIVCLYKANGLFGEQELAISLSGIEWCSLYKEASLYRSSYSHRIK